MNRGAGTGLIGFGIVLVIVGATLDFAITVTTSGFNINTIGLILLIAGIVMTIVGIAVFAMGSSNRTSIHEDVRTTPGGTTRDYEERGNVA